jgi:putative phosphoesterase
LRRLRRTASQEIQNPSKLQESPAKTVGLISDTHIPHRARKIPDRVYDIFDHVDFIVHAGDLVQLSVIDDLEQIAPVLAVSGNMDGPEVRGKLPRVSSMKVFDWKIGVTHNPGALFGMRRMLETAKRNRFDVLVYGHTHSSNIKREQDILFINPGSARARCHEPTIHTPINSARPPTTE